jgi:DNA-binding IscR family transcriptional regulator
MRYWESFALPAFSIAPKGRGGGDRLARGLYEIKVGQVIRAIHGPLAPIACASRMAYQSCTD